MRSVQIVARLRSKESSGCSVVTISIGSRRIAPAVLIDVIWFTGCCSIRAEGGCSARAAVCARLTRPQDNGTQPCGMCESIRPQCCATVIECGCLRAVFDKWPERQNDSDEKLPSVRLQQPPAR